MTFGEKLRNLREERGFSQTDLAGITGFTRRPVYNWERDKKHPKNIATLEQHKIDVIMSGMTTTSFRIGATTPEENATRLEGAPRTVFEKLPSAEAEVKRLYQEVEDCKEGLGKPFPKEEEYKEKTLRFNEVNLLIEEQNKQEDQQVTKTLEAKQEEAVAR